MALAVQSAANAYPVSLDYIVYRNDYPPSANEGGGRVFGSFNFTGTKSLNYDVDIQDLCNFEGKGDGLGVGFSFVFYPVGGGTAIGSLKGKDTNGCGSGVVPAAGTITRANAQSKAQPIACATQDGTCFFTVNGGYGQIGDNPYT